MHKTQLLSGQIIEYFVKALGTLTLNLNDQSQEQLRVLNLNPVAQSKDHTDST